MFWMFQVQLTKGVLQLHAVLWNIWRQDGRHCCLWNIHMMYLHVFNCNFLICCIWYFKGMLLPVLGHIVYFWYSLNKMSLLYTGVETDPTWIKLLDDPKLIYPCTLSEISLNESNPCSDLWIPGPLFLRRRGKQARCHASGPYRIRSITFGSYVTVTHRSTTTLAYVFVTTSFVLSVVLLLYKDENTQLRRLSKQGVC